MKRGERIDKKEAFLLYLKWFNTKTTQQEEGHERRPFP